MLIDKSLRDLLAAFAAPDPTPGGGSAAAAAASIGASLLVMVASLPKTRSNSDEDRAAIARVRPDLERAARELAAAVDADSAAYDAVVAAYKLPKGTPEEQTRRKAAVQAAMQRATEVPLQVMRLSAAALRSARTIAEHGHRPAASDAGVGIALITAGLHGARLNVNANLGSVTDEGYRSTAAAESDRLEREARADADAATGALAA